MDAEWWSDYVAWGLAAFFSLIFIVITFKFDKWPVGTSLGMKLFTTIGVILASYAMSKIQLDRG